MEAQFPPPFCRRWTAAQLFGSERLLSRRLPDPGLQPVGVRLAERERRGVGGGIPPPRRQKGGGAGGCG